MFLPGERTQEGRIATLNLLDPFYDKMKTYGLRGANSGRDLLICAAQNCTVCVTQLGLPNQTISVSSALHMFNRVLIAE